MINPNVEVKINKTPYKWIEIKNPFNEKDKISLCNSYPTDNYRTIFADNHERQYNYDAKSLVRLNGSIPNNELLSNSWKEFADYLNSLEYRAFISNITGVDVMRLPMEANIYKYTKDCFMDAHPDLNTKVLVNIFYFNIDWKEEHGGCLRILNSKDENDVFTKVLPLVDNSVIIIRDDNSWHSVDKTVVDESRRAVTVTFYKENASSPMWVEGENYELHNNTI